jgi:hypothetical protein
MDDREKALLFGSIRLGIGTALVVAPGFAGRIWVGDHADGPGARVFARAIGARDAVLGFRTLEAVRDKKEARNFLEAGYLADAADVAATVIAWKHLTPGRRIAMPIIAAAVGALGYTVAKVLD